METFSFNKFGQLIRFYWRQEYKLYLIVFAALTFTAILIDIIGYFHPDMPDYYFLITMLFLILSNNWMFRHTYTKEGSIEMYSLPANNLEKYLSRIVFCLFIYFGIAVLARGLAYGVQLLYCPEIAHFFPVGEISFVQPSLMVALVIWLVSALILTGLSFRWLGFILVDFLFGLLLLVFPDVLNPEVGPASMVCLLSLYLFSIIHIVGGYYLFCRAQIVHYNFLNI